jgi:hypothetical protein
MANNTPLQSTTQQFLDIHDIANDMVIMKDASTSMILTVNAINFGLFAEEEQDAVIYAYAGLLNSLNFPIQIVVRSQTKDATAYLRLLQDQEEQIPDPRKQARIKRYREFVSQLIREGNVLDKKFYLVVSASALEMGFLPPQTVIPGIKHPDIAGIERSVILEKARNILEPKRDHMIGQFGRIGLQARQLNTQEIIQLFYTIYNPEAAEGQQITDTRSYTTALVSASMATMPTAPIPIMNTTPAAALGLNTPVPASINNQYQSPIVGETMTDASMPASSNPTPAATEPVAPTMPAATPAPAAAPVTTPSTPVTPAPTTPVASPAPAQPAAAPGPQLEVSTQAEINSVLQNMGSAASETAAAPAASGVSIPSTPAISTNPAAPAGGMPPLPEI